MTRTREHLVQHLDKKTARKYGKLPNGVYGFNSLQTFDTGAIELLNKMLHLKPEEVTELNSRYLELSFGPGFKVHEKEAKEIATIPFPSSLRVSLCSKEAAFVLMEAKRVAAAAASIDKIFGLMLPSEPLKELIVDAVTAGLEGDLVPFLYDEARDTAVMSSGFDLPDLEFKDPRLVAAVIKIAYPVLITSTILDTKTGLGDMQADLDNYDVNTIITKLSKTAPEVLAEAFFIMIKNYRRPDRVSTPPKMIPVSTVSLDLINNTTSVPQDFYDKGSNRLQRTNYAINRVDRIIAFMKHMNKIMDDKDNALPMSYHNASPHFDSVLIVEQGAMPYSEDIINKIIDVSKSGIRIKGALRACQNVRDMHSADVIAPSTIALKNLNIVKNNSAETSVPVFMESVDTSGVFDAGLSKGLKGFVTTTLIAPILKLQPNSHLTYKDYQYADRHRQTDKFREHYMRISESVGRRFMIKLAQGVPVMYEDINPILEAIEDIENLVPGNISDIPERSKIDDPNSFGLVFDFFRTHTDMSEDAIYNLAKVILLPPNPIGSTLTYDVYTRFRLAKYIIEATAGALVNIVIPATCPIAKTLVKRIKQFNERPACTFSPTIRHRFSFKGSALSYSHLNPYDKYYGSSNNNKGIASVEAKMHKSYYEQFGDIQVPFVGYDVNGIPIIKTKEYLDLFRATENGNSVDISIVGHNMCKYSATFSDGLYLSIITSDETLKAAKALVKIPVPATASV